ncbi:DUF397 domain-containing protein [Actinomadura rupiterrae]|uniref:DUF397 domain-containing protein n=1 Tax=Actinomadura rupiterrae TaxID=559627 RepID=UPI0020A3B2F2|nr:DUF397 domain-containing protein [Actinomadura rupiterrae]MCP2336444.1 hypothetical protein [Actinomadura rupiterrae]
MITDHLSAVWRKSSYSNSDQECVEAAAWRKSSYSDAERECVEVARAETAVGLRDSKAPENGHLEFAPAAFGGFLARVKSGDLDL